MSRKSIFGKRGLFYNQIFQITLLAFALILAFLMSSGMVSFDLWPRAKEVPANIVVDALIVGNEVNLDFYHAFAQGGEEKGDMLAPAANLVKALSPKIIRLDHIFNQYNMVRRDAGQLHFDFTQIDTSIRTILSAGAVPLLSLSYMPPAIARGGNILEQPDNWNEWALVVERLIEHVSGRTGLNVSGVYYEVWNEPDLAQFGSWKTWGAKNYLTLYQYAATGAGRANNANTFYLGGPATTGMYPNWIKALAKSGSRLDFISWHGYIQNPVQYATDIQNAQLALLDYPHYAYIPLLITEFGHTGARDTGYGTMYSAVHTASTIRQLITNPPRYLFSFELIDGPGQTNGDGWGMITHEDNGLRTKPRYGVYSYMDQMMGKRVSLTGEGTEVNAWATTEGNTIKIMLVNFSSRGISENVPITYKNVEPGSYRFIRHQYLGNRGQETVEVSAFGLMKTVYVPAQSIVYVALEKI